MAIGLLALGASAVLPTTGSAGLLYDDKDFIQTAAMGGMTEVQLGKLAQEKGASAEVREFGAMMVKDHSALNSDVKALAEKKGVEVPAVLDKKHQEKVEDLGKKSGKDFDKEYFSLMETAHKKDLALFKRAQESTKDADVKQAAEKAIPVISGHADHLKTLEAKK